MRKFSLASGASLTGGHGLLTGGSLSSASSSLGAYRKPYAGLYAGTGASSLNLGINGLSGYKTYGNSYGTSSSSLAAVQKLAASQGYDCGSDIGMFLSQF